MFKFGKEGEFFQTVFGGIISLLIYFGIFAFTCFRFYILFTRQASNISSVAQALDPNDLGNVYLNQSKMLNFVTFYYTSGDTSTFNYKEYLNAQFQVKFIDYSNNTN